MSEPISAMTVFELGLWAFDRDPPVAPSVDQLTRFQMGVADEPEVEAILDATATYEESANLLADVAELRVELENLADVDLKAIALEGGIRAQVAQEILDIRETGRAALQKSSGGLGESIAALLRSLADGVISRREAASVRALRLPPAVAIYRDGGALRGAWEGEELVVSLPRDVTGTVELRTEGDLVLAVVQAAGEPVRIPIAGGQSALSLLLAESEEPLVRYRPA